jgi:hypothetical protein
MRGTGLKSVLIALVILACQPFAPAKERVPAGRMSTLDRAIAFAVYLEAHANRLDNRTDVCVAFGHGLAVDEQGILSELKSRKLKMHANGWCNEGPRGLVISIIGPTTESASGTYDLVVEVGDLRPLQQGGEHFATLLRKGTYGVKCKDGSEPELVRYQESELPGNQ